MVELADTLDLGSSGRPWGFESLYAHHFNVEISTIFDFKIKNGVKTI